MKILVTAAQFSSSLSGLQRHALNLVRALLRQPEISSVHLAIAPWQRSLVQQADFGCTDRLDIHIAEMGTGPLDRNLWHFHRLPQLAAAIHPDIVHLTYPVPVRASALGCPVVLTLHDLYPFDIPGNFGFPKVIFNRAILRHCLRNADAIVCVSDSTLRRLRDRAPDSWSRAHRIYNCVEPEMHAEPDPFLRDWNVHPFLLTVSQHRRNKNISLLIRVFDRLLGERRIDPGMKLLVVGIPGPETARLHRLVSKHRLTDRVLFLQGLSDSGLQWCYRNAETLLAPSHIEGFGLPVVEALLAGCRVICSDIPAFREIAAGDCRFVRLGFTAEAAFADAIVAALRSPPSSPLSFPQFSSRAIGFEHVDLYRSLVSATASTKTWRGPAPALAIGVNEPSPGLRRNERC